MHPPLPQTSEQSDFARTVREGCARMVEEANTGLLAPIHVAIATAIAAILLRLIDLFELWRDTRPAEPAAQPPAPRQAAPRPRARARLQRSRSRTRRTPSRNSARRRAPIRPPFALAQSAPPGRTTHPPAPAHPPVRRTIKIQA